MFRRAFCTFLPFVTWTSEGKREYSQEAEQTQDFILRNESKMLQGVWEKFRWRRIIPRGRWGGTPFLPPATRLPWPLGARQDAQKIEAAERSCPFHVLIGRTRVNANSIWKNTVAVEKVVGAVYIMPSLPTRRLALQIHLFIAFTRSILRTLPKRTKVPSVEIPKVKKLLLDSFSPFRFGQRNGPSGQGIP